MTKNPSPPEIQSLCVSAATVQLLIPECAVRPQRVIEIRDAMLATLTGCTRAEIFAALCDVILRAEAAETIDFAGLPV